MNTILFPTIGLCLYLYYLLVLRRFNSLGLWAFSLLVLASATVAMAGFQKNRKLQAQLAFGRAVQAKVIAKQQEAVAGSATVHNAITVLLSIDGVPQTVSLYKGITAEDWLQVTPGKTAKLLVMDDTHEVVLQASLVRSSAGLWVYYAVALALLLLGCAFGLLLQQYMVRARNAEQETDDDWFTEPAFETQPTAPQQAVYTLRRQQHRLLPKLQTLQRPQ